MTLPPMPEFVELEYSVGLTRIDFNNWYDEHIESLFKGAVEVNRWSSLKHDYWCTSLSVNADHRAWLVGIEPIQRGVTKDEIVSVLRGWAEPLDMNGKEMKELADRIEREGLKP